MFKNLKTDWGISLKKSQKGREKNGHIQILTGFSNYSYIYKITWTINKTSTDAAGCWRTSGGIDPWTGRIWNSGRDFIYP